MKAPNSYDKYCDVKSVPKRDRMNKSQIDKYISDKMGATPQDLAKRGGGKVYYNLQFDSGD